jgi:hypothetical protein
LPSDPGQLRRQAIAQTGVFLPSGHDVRPRLRQCGGVVGIGERLLSVRPRLRSGGLGGLLYDHDGLLFWEFGSQQAQVDASPGKILDYRGGLRLEEGEFWKSWEVL